MIVGDSKLSPNASLLLAPWASQLSMRLVCATAHGAHHVENVPGAPTRARIDAGARAGCVHDDRGLNRIVAPELIVSAWRPTRTRTRLVVTALPSPAWRAASARQHKNASHDRHTFEVLS